MNTEAPDTPMAQPADSKRSGLRFVIPAVIPSLLMAGASMLGAPPMAGFAMAAVAGFTGTVITAGAAGVAAVGAVGAAGLAGAVSAAGAAFAAALGVAGIAGIAADEVAKDLDKKYSPEKVFAGIVGGSALGAALAYGVAVNDAPQAPEKAVPPSTLHIETRGGDLCRDFKLSENNTATQTTNDKGKKTYTLTAPKGCVIMP